MKQNIVIFYITLISVMMLFAIPASSQPYDSDRVSEKDSLYFQTVEFSLLTCQPHDEVYSLYGHTAIRIVDKTKGADIVANWGVFDSRKPNFVVRFVFGLTDYMMGVLPTDLFLGEYRYYGCGVYQQRLDLSWKEKQVLMRTLEKNFLPENREYRYNFIFDNCTSRARDVIVTSLDGEVLYRPTEMQRGERSFRQLIHWKNADYPWAAVGNDLLLGLQADRNTDMSERQFLPEILMADFDSAVVVKETGERRALVDTAYWVLEPSVSPLKTMGDIPLSPHACSLIVLAIVLAICVFEKCKIHKHLYVVDRVMFFIYGILGIVLTAMIFSLHPTVRINLQIFLFCPFLLLLAFIPKFWEKGYKMIFLLIILFYMGNIFQSYAEGMNILALSLLIRILTSDKLKLMKTVTKR